MPVIEAFGKEAVHIPAPYERIIRVLLAPDTQEIVSGMTVSHCVIAPNGGKTDFHMHPGVEMMYIITGYGKCTIGDEEFDLKPDVLIVAPPKTMHDMRNYCDETMKLVAMYIPAETSAQILERARKAAKTS
ncbi:MAG: cupin domain-containing protein [Rhodopila sp.]|nr:cupin domain-containing protein [Rhodopila sp.]